MIKVTKLTKKFKITNHEISVFNNLDFTIKKGEWVSITGASGSGKSTLLYMLGILDNPTSGDIYCEGKSYSKMTSIQKNSLRLNKIGFIFQAFYLFPELDARENVILPALIKGTSKKEAIKKAEELLENIGLKERLKHLPAELSGGEQQRVAVARALINNPELILADEPTGNLDDKNSKEITEIFSKLNKKEGKTIIMVTHQNNDAKLANRILKLENKNIICSSE